MIKNKAFIAATEKTSKEVAIGIKKEYDFSEANGEVPFKVSLIFPISLEESDPDLLISSIN